jgi:hypothetical protein
MAQTTLPTDLAVTGNLTVQGATTLTSLNVANADVSNARVIPAAGISASKLQHQHWKTYAQPGGSTTATQRFTIHVGTGTAGTVLGFIAGQIVASLTTATVSVDLKKNGTSILSAPIALGTTAAYVTLAATISSAAYVAGDVFEVVVTASASGGTLGEGVFAQMLATESAA